MGSIILFDIDGTLILTGGAGMRAMGRAFHEVFGVPDAFADVPMPGRTDAIIVAEALEKCGVRQADGLLGRFRDVYFERLAEEISLPTPGKRVLPGVRPLLEALVARDDVLVGLLTGNYTASARIKLEFFGLWRYFRCGAFGEEAFDRNGLVQVALDRAERCGVSPAVPADVIVVGDTPFDVACALNSGARAVAVATGGSDAETLYRCGAEVVFQDLKETADFLSLLD
jgi:phosphoglycolate phosphatase